jgi:hypothetical protein
MSESKENKNYQLEWDSALIRGWVHNKNMASVLGDFYRNVAPILNKLNDYHRSIAYLVSLDLKRSTSKNRGERRLWLKQSVRAFVDTHSRQLTNLLYNPDFEKKEILAAIDNCRWSDADIYSSGRHNQYQRSRNAYRATRVIHARDLSKKHDWKTVK